MDEVVERLKSEQRNPYLWNLAKGYRLNVLPSFYQRVRRGFIDMYPNDLPGEIYDKYEDKRLPSVRMAFKIWKEEYGKAPVTRGRPPFDSLVIPGEPREYVEEQL